MKQAELTLSEAQQEIERNFRWNFTVNALDGTSFWLGSSFISISIILPLYISHFTSSPLLIGLIPFLNSAGYLLPQIFIANAVEHAPRKKFFPVTLGFFFQRMPIFLMAPAAFFLAARQPVWALTAFLILYAWYNIGSGFEIVGWQDMIAKIFPVKMRGRFFGLTSFLGNGAGILGALAVPFILQKYTFPTGFMICFGAAAVLIFMSWFFLSLTREPAVRSSKPAISQMDYLRSLPEVLRKDKNFRIFLLTSIISSFSVMATGFLAVYAVKMWNIADATASGFTVAMQIGLALFNLLFGFLADRKGHKINLVIIYGINVLSLILAIIARSPWLFFVVFFLRGAFNAGGYVSGMPIVYEFTDSENRATYIGLANTIPGLAGAVAPLLGGWLAANASYSAMFLLSAVIGLVCWGLLIFGVREPRRMIEVK